MHKNVKKHGSPLRCLQSRSVECHHPLCYCQSWICGECGGVCRAAPDLAPHNVSCPSGLQVNGPAHTECRWRTPTQHTDRKNTKTVWISNVVNQKWNYKIPANTCNLDEHVDFSYFALEIFESWNNPGKNSPCFQWVDLHLLAHSWYHLNKPEDESYKKKYGKYMTLI